MLARVPSRTSPTVAGLHSRGGMMCSRSVLGSRPWLVIGSINCNQWSLISGHHSILRPDLQPTWDWEIIKMQSSTLTSSDQQTCPSAMCKHFYGVHSWNIKLLCIFQASQIKCFLSIWRLKSRITAWVFSVPFCLDQTIHKLHSF